MLRIDLLGVQLRKEAQGYSIVPISQLIYKDNYTIDAAGMQVPNTTAMSNCSTSKTS